MNLYRTVNVALRQQSVDLEVDHKGLGWHLELCEGFDSYYCRRVGFVEEKVQFLARQVSLADLVSEEYLAPAPL